MDNPAKLGEFTRNNGESISGFYFNPRREDKKEINFIEWKLTDEIEHWCKSQSVEIETWHFIKDNKCTHCENKVPDFVLLCFKLGVHAQG